MDKLAQCVEGAIAEGVFPGCVIGVLNNGVTHVRAFGTTDGTEETHAGTVYDLASITKSIPVAMLASIFIAEGQLKLDDPIKRFVPELRNDFGATVEDLLRYRVNGPRMSTLHFRTFEEVRAHALEQGFDGPPGRGEYANFPAFVLGIVLERIGGAHLATLAHHRIFEPFRMTHTTFFPAAEDCAPTEIVAGEIIRGLPHDESARIFAKARRTVGHAGLFSTADDLLSCASHLLEQPLSEMTQYAIKGLGWQVDAPYLSGPNQRDVFGKTGFTGTSIAIDTIGQRALVLLSNRTFPHRPPDGRAINTVRRAVAEIAWSS